jgi:hypothetical protein
MQYTLRDIPTALDAELRRRARSAGKSLNAVAIEALKRGAGLVEESAPQRDLGDIAGTWLEDDEFDQAVKDQQRVDRRQWR